MDRGDLKDLGETLDAGQAALVVAAASDVADKVRAAMANAAEIEARQVQVAAEEMEKESKDAQEEAESSS